MMTSACCFCTEEYRIPGAEKLDLSRVLPVGQSFRWHKGTPSHEEAQVWWGVFGGKMWCLRLRKGDFIARCCPNKVGDGMVNELKEYLAIGPLFPCKALVSEFKRLDPLFSAYCAEEDVPITLLRQDPFETLLAFICSSNNNIKRISLMIERMCDKFGRRISCPNQCEQRIEWKECAFRFSFPRVEDFLSSRKEDELVAILRGLGLGYRAKYIAKSIAKLGEKGDCFFEKLRHMEVKECRLKLIQEFSGVGPKVADCVMLMGLQKMNVVPCDVHMLKVCSQYSFCSANTKSLTLKKYEEISAKFQVLWGPYAGFAQAIVFSNVVGNKNRK